MHDIETVLLPCDSLLKLKIRILLSLHHKTYTHDKENIWVKKVQYSPPNVKAHVQCTVIE